MSYLALFFGGGALASFATRNPAIGFSLSGFLTIIVLILEGIAAIKQIFE